jgi:hypothetical protein
MTTDVDALLAKMRSAHAQANEREARTGNPDDPEVRRLRHVVYQCAVEAAPYVHPRPAPIIQQTMAGAPRSSARRSGNGTSGPAR